jgi:phage terminase large subunit-like protein
MRARIHETGERTVSDWRLTNQEQYLKGSTLRFGAYRQPRADWDHDHCAFCWAKFMEPPAADTLREGYSTLDERTWICPRCFEDFKAMFAWRVDSDPSGPESAVPR